MHGPRQVHLRHHGRQGTYTAAAHGPRVGSGRVADARFATRPHGRLAQTVVHGIIGGISIVFPITPADACKMGFTNGCPIAAGGSFNYTIELPVLSSYPSVKQFLVKWEVQDQSGDDVFCFQVSAGIS